MDTYQHDYNWISEFPDGGAEPDPYQYYNATIRFGEYYPNNYDTSGSLLSYVLHSATVGWSPDGPFAGWAIDIGHGWRNVWNTEDGP